MPLESTAAHDLEILGKVNQMDLIGCANEQVRALSNRAVHQFNRQLLVDLI